MRSLLSEVDACCLGTKSCKVYKIYKKTFTDFAINTTISLEMKCPQLSKPEATAARNQNSIGDRMEKKTLGETRLGADPPSDLDTDWIW